MDLIRAANRYPRSMPETAAEYQQERGRLERALSLDPARRFAWERRGHFSMIRLRQRRRTPSEVALAKLAGAERDAMWHRFLGF